MREIDVVHFLIDTAQCVGLAWIGIGMRRRIKRLEKLERTMGGMEVGEIERRLGAAEEETRQIARRLGIDTGSLEIGGGEIRVANWPGASDVLVRETEMAVVQSRRDSKAD